MCIKLHFYLIPLTIYFYAIHKLKMFLSFYFFAILHEMAHIVIAIILKVKIKEIVILPVGVCAKYDYIEAKWREVIIAAAGPLFSILMFIFHNTIIVKEINLAIAILNLIPIYPLDGGRILRGILEIVCGFKKSIIISNLTSKILLISLCFLGIIMAVYLKNYSLIILGLYVYILIKEELKKDRIRKIINELIGE